MRLRRQKYSELQKTKVHKDSKEYIDQRLRRQNCPKTQETKLAKDLVDNSTLCHSRYN